MHILVSHNFGFFSCCSVILHFVTEFCNTYKQLPEKIDSSCSFGWYKPEDKGKDDVTYDYFEPQQSNEVAISSTIRLPFTHNDQYIEYTKLNYALLEPFVRKYFTPNLHIRRLICDMEQKYNLPNIYNDICVLFYRGNDKRTESELCTYEMVIEQAKLVQEKNPNILFLIQSDETEFIQRMTETFPNSFYFKDEIRHINSQIDTVDKCMAETNCEFSKKYLAITIIMSKCRYVVCGSGNCSLWIMLYRNHANNVIQFKDGTWYTSLHA
jgi:hypothetical protein